jgi:hypothetical protein
LKTLFAVLCCALATASFSWAADVPTAKPIVETTPASTLSAQWSATVTSDVRYFSWRSDRGYPTSTALADFRGSGSEIYIPYALQLVGRPIDDIKIEILGRAGWVRARQSTFGLNGEVKTPTDTVANTTITYLGLNGFQPFVSVDFNFPTGKSALFGTAANARMDPDLVDIASFGEGFNVGPTAGFNLPLTNNLIATASVGYTQRGSFTRERSLTPTDPTAQAPSDISPGNVLTVTASLGYQVGSLTSKVTGSISSEMYTKVDGLDAFRPGLRYLITGDWTYAWPETWGSTNLTASVSLARRNKVQFLDPQTLNTVALDYEPLNSNSNVYLVRLQHLFPVGMFSVGPLGSYLYRNRNGYNSETLQFVPAKTRWSAGVLAGVTPNDHISLNARVERVWTLVADDPVDIKTSLLLLPNSFIPGFAVPPISSTGWQFSGGLSIKF